MCMDTVISISSLFIATGSFLVAIITLVISTRIQTEQKNEAVLANKLVTRQDYIDNYRYLSEACSLPPINGNRVTDKFWRLINKAYTDAQLILPTKDIEEYIKIIHDLMWECCEINIYKEDLTINDFNSPAEYEKWKKDKKSANEKFAAADKKISEICFYEGKKRIELYSKYTKL